MASTALKKGYSHGSVCCPCQRSGRSLALFRAEAESRCEHSVRRRQRQELGQSLFCRAGHSFSSLMWFIPSSQGRRINQEPTAHEFVIRAAVMQASLLQSLACFSAARLPVEHTLAAPRQRPWDSKCAGASLEERKTTPGVQFLLPLCAPWLAGT